MTPDPFSSREGAGLPSLAHYIIPRGVVYAKCTSGVCIVVRLTTALERTPVMVDYEKKRKSQCTAPDKMVLFCVEYYHRSFKSRGARLAEERRRNKKIEFSTHVDL